MVNVENRVTVVMTTYNNNDFTKASVWSIKKFYPKLRIILADGGSSINNYEELISLSKKDIFLDVVQFYDGYSEDCRNMASSLVETEFILFMDNDTKLLSNSAIDLMVETMDENECIAQTGAYAIGFVDKENYFSFIGKNFNASIEADGFSSYFSLHRKKFFDEVKGFPKEFLYVKENKKKKNNQLEKFSNIQHEIWSNWMKYLFTDKENVDRWKRQMETPYKDLSEKEKQLDRDVVLQYILKEEF
jgi:GT2 family glycosyltransferase